ncbi:MAG: hypothetical protein R2788_24095 [Saprospiraceae bacterium]
MVKFENKTGKNIENLLVSRASVGDVGKGKRRIIFNTTNLANNTVSHWSKQSAILIYERYFTSPPPAPGHFAARSQHLMANGWPGYYKIAIRISDELGGIIT